MSAIFRFRNALDGSTPTIRSRRAGCTPRRLQKYTLPPNAAPDMGVTSAQSRARGASVSGARDGLGDGVDSIAFRMAKERAVLAEKRAKMTQVRAVDLEQRVKDKDAHIQLLQEELVNYANVSTTASASADASARAANREVGHRGLTASASSAARDSTIRQLAERLRRAELHAERRAATLEDRCAKAEARAAKAETKVSEMKTSRLSKGVASGKLKDDVELKLRRAQANADSLAKELEFLSDFVARHHGACRGVVRDDGDVYSGFLKSEQPEVFGTCTYACGDVYIGEWKNGKPHGFGECVFKTGCRYEGGWCTGGYHGKGVYTYSSGDVFEGSWENDERHGVGVCKDKSGQLQREEIYVHGELKSTSGENDENNDGGRSSGNTSGSADTKTSEGNVGQKEMREMRLNLFQRYDLSWRAFESNFLSVPSKTIDWHDVPWPPQNVPLVLVEEVLDESITSSPAATRDAALKLTAERKRRYVEETKRWHPDKWTGKTLAPHAREQIMAEVTAVFRRVDAEKRQAGL